MPPTPHHPICPQGPPTGARLAPVAIIGAEDEDFENDIEPVSRGGGCRVGPQRLTPPPLIYPHPFVPPIPPPPRPEPGGPEQPLPEPGAAAAAPGLSHGLPAPRCAAVRLLPCGEGPGGRWSWGGGVSPGLGGGRSVRWGAAARPPPPVTSSLCPPSLLAGAGAEVKPGWVGGFGGVGGFEGSGGCEGVSLCPHSPLPPASPSCAHCTWRCCGG